jgi:hypothetical protein
MSRLRRLSKATAKGLCALLLALALTEIALRVVGFRLPPRGPDNFLPLLEKVSAADAPGLEKVLIPGARGEVLYPGKTPAENRTVTYRVNSGGFRDFDAPLAKPAGVRRVVVLGDSVTYGTGVDLKNTLPKQLELALRELCPGQAVEVLNFGVYAYNTRQEVALLEYRALQYQPDWVLLVATVTDASGWGVAKQCEPSWQAAWIRRLGLRSGVWEDADVANAPVQNRVANELRRVSVLADFVANRMYVSLRSAQLEVDYNRDWEDGAPGRPVIRESLERLGQLAREKGFEAKVLMYPTLTKLGEDYPYRFPSEVLERECQEVGLGFVDLLPAVVGREARALEVHEHDRHPNGNCNGLVARWLAKRLEREWCEGK